MGRVPIGSHGITRLHQPQMESDLMNNALEKAIKEMEAFNTEQARMARHNDLMAARSAEMKASARGRRFIAKYGDPIDQQNKLPKRNFFA